MPRISLVVLRCSSIEKALAFYRALGLEFIEERHGSGPVHYASEVGDTVLEIYPAPAPVSVRHERVGFQVESLEGVLAAVERSGGSVESSSLHEDVPHAVVVDPDGRKVELCES
jgi:lactoylglutathione lyase